MAHHAEVIVVGGGPAGAVVALEMARRRRDVLVLEGARFPREKPCGDCLNPGAVRELEALGIAERLRAALDPQPLLGWRVEAPDGRFFRAAFSPGGEGAACGWAVRRRDFDAALLDEAVRAGARVEFGVRVFDVVRERGRVCGVRARAGSQLRELRARFVVGADGLRSVVQRRLGLMGRPPRLRKLALVGHLALPNGAGAYGEMRVRGGRTCGYAPLRGGANVTLVVPAHEAASLRGEARGFLVAALAGFPEVHARALRCGLEETVMVTGPFDRPVRRRWARGVVLAGDAAGYYDPFTGQGIYQAVRSGRLAAEAIAASLAQPAGEASALRAYERRLRRALAPTRALQHLIEAVIRRPRLMSACVRGLSGGGPGPAAAVRLLRATGDLAHPLSLLDPLLWARLVYGVIGER
jgi:flavin-dependent dehydrogenase